MRSLAEQVILMTGATDGMRKAVTMLLALPEGGSSVSILEEGVAGHYAPDHRP